MLNKVSAFIRSHNMISPGDRVICAISGGADSVALLWAMYLLREKFSITVEAVHYNHGLRGEESLRDQAFVQEICQRYDIPLHLGSSSVKAGDKGLEAAARDARYGFFSTLEGKIATAHTADDNAETVLMHLIRGTGLKGLGGISPIRGNIIRPMLQVTRQEVLDFLQEYCLRYVVDSSNDTDQFLRNRIRHHLMPLLKNENPSFSENISAMALRLRQDEQILHDMSLGADDNIFTIRQMEPAIRYRYLADFLEKSGVREPSSEHITLAENLVFSQNPSAKANFPHGVTIGRNYEKLIKMSVSDSLEDIVLPCPGKVELPESGFSVISVSSTEPVLTWNRFTVYPQGDIHVRSRKAGDRIRLHGGTKSLKELFVDKKIPASQRPLIPVIADDLGVLGVWGIGANLDRTTGTGACVEIRFDSKR